MSLPLHKGHMTTLNCNVKRMSGTATHCNRVAMSWSGSPKTQDRTCIQR
jgi:hypothetical protein